MLLRLSKNAFVRQYGPFTYIVERIRNFDQVYRDAEVFMRWITRVAAPIEKIISNICNAFPEIPCAQIENDFWEFMSPLMTAKVVVLGETEAEIQSKEESFSYDVADPKTFNLGNDEVAHGDEQLITQNVLDEYFAKHPRLYSLHVDLTRSCNERCVHCYIPEHKNIFLEFGKVKEVIDEFAVMGGLTISFSGGECMLHPNFEEIVRYARKRDLIISVLSNLTLCDNKIARLLQEVEATVQVSLYSMKAETHDEITKIRGSFFKTKGAIEMLRECNVPCLISCPTMKSNFRDYLDVLNFARSLKMDAQTDMVIMGKMNCDTSNLGCRLNIDQTRQVLEDIVFRSVPVNNETFNPKKKSLMLTDAQWSDAKVCGACVDCICLDATGDYYPCPGFAGVQLGNCYKNSLSWVWNESSETIRIRGVTGKDFPKCVHCENRNFCTACMCRNYNETGDIFTPAAHFCEVARIGREVVEKSWSLRTDQNS